MATKVVMEALSPTMEEGRLVEWKKGEGEPVAVGDVLAEVETDKAVMELVARAGGTLLKQVVPAGTTVPVSELVALIGEPGEAVDNGKPTAAPEQATQAVPGQNRPVSMPPAPPARAATESAPPRPLDRADPRVLSHPRGGHGAGLGRARSAQGARRRPQGRGPEGVVQRHHHQGGGHGAPATPGLQRLVAGRPDPLLARGTCKHGGSDRGRPDHAGHPQRRSQVAARDRDRIAGPRRAGTRAPAHA